MITRVIIDSVFIIVVLLWIIYNYFFLQTMTNGEFVIAIMVNYCGARYLLFSDLQYALLAVEYGESDE